MSYRGPWHRDRCHNSFLALVNFQCFISQIFNATFVNYQWDISQFYMTAPFSWGHKLPFIYFSPGGTRDTESPLSSLQSQISLFFTETLPPAHSDPVKHRTRGPYYVDVDYRERGESTSQPVTLMVEIKNSLRDILNQDQDQTGA